MPYIQRENGAIVGVYANPQPYAEEFLPDDSEEVLSFMSANSVGRENVAGTSEREIRDAIAEAEEKINSGAPQSEINAYLLGLLKAVL